MKPFAAALAVVFATPAAAMDLESFRTPSDNIHCMFIRDEGASLVECELRTQTNAKPALPRPADCDLDWGSRFALDAKGKAGMACHGDTLVSPDAPVLDYGRSLGWDGITCSSEQTGLTCKNRRGRGFTLSRASQSLF